ncbi:MAG: hypothetical protein JWP47_3062 [Polaromonas sp.]|nr:hypothetical protein [Polaromonas sp.]
MNGRLAAIATSCSCRRGNCPVCPGNPGCASCRHILRGANDTPRVASIAASDTRERKRHRSAPFFRPGLHLTLARWMSSARALASSSQASCWMCWRDHDVRKIIRCPTTALTSDRDRDGEMPAPVIPGPPRPAPRLAAGHVPWLRFRAIPVLAPNRPPPPLQPEHTRSGP